MLYCAVCGVDLKGIELEDKTKCPFCENLLGEIKSGKLIDIMLEINAAVKTINSQDQSQRINVKQVIDAAKIMERGEKKMQREFEKRMEELQSIQFEIEVIKHFSGFMNYVLTESKEVEELAPDNASE